MNQLFVTLLFVAALALLPAWLVGSLALGAALGLWLCSKPKHYIEREKSYGTEPRAPDTNKVISLTGTRAQAARFRRWGKGEQL